MLTAHGDARFPHTTVADLEDNTRWDGIFHAGTWLLVVAGLFLLVAAARSRGAVPSLLGSLSAGAAGFVNVAENRNRG